MPKNCAVCDLSDDFKQIVREMHQNGLSVHQIQQLLEQEAGQHISEPTLHRHLFGCLKAQALVPLEIDKTEPPHRVEHAIFSFYDFFKEAWPHMDAEPFVDNWHIHSLCEIFEAMMKGEIENKKLVVNMPPRMGKTNLISVAWVAWAWTFNPSLKFIYASYKGDVSENQSRLCRKLIESEWYQTRWGQLFELEKDQSTKDHFANTKHGSRISTSIQSDITSFGCDIFVLDDPNGLNDSAVDFERAQNYLRTVCPSRLNPRGLNIQVVVQQRVSKKDITGFIQQTDTTGLWQHFVLPLEFDPHINTQVVSTSGKVWKDQRTQAGEVLWPEFFTEKWMQLKKATLTTDKALTEYAGQYQQRPVPQSGAFFKRKDFLVYDLNLLDAHSGIMVLANHIDFKPLQEKHEAACVVMSLYQLGNRNRMVIMGAWTGQVTLQENIHQIVRMAHDCRLHNEKKIDEGQIRYREIKACYFDKDNKIIDLKKLNLIRNPKKRVLPKEYIAICEPVTLHDRPQYRSNYITVSSDMVADDLWNQGGVVKNHFKIHPFEANSDMINKNLSDEETGAFIKRFMGEAEHVFIAPPYVYSYLSDFLNNITAYPEEGSHALGRALMNGIAYCWATRKVKTPWATGDLLRYGHFKDADYWEAQATDTKMKGLVHQAFKYIQIGNQKI